MLRYIFGRLALTIPLLVGAAILIFFIMQLVPGDAVSAMMTGGAKFSPEQQEQIREALGLNRPLLVQLGEYLLGLVQGDLGRSVSGRSVLDLIGAQIPSTLILVADTRAWVYGWHGRENTCSRSPHSTIFPRYITATCSHT